MVFLQCNAIDQLWEMLPTPEDVIKNLVDSCRRWARVWRSATQVVTFAKDYDICIWLPSKQKASEGG